MCKQVTFCLFVCFQLGSTWPINVCLTPLYKKMLCLFFVVAVFIFIFIFSEAHEPAIFSAVSINLHYIKNSVTEIPEVGVQPPEWLVQLQLYA